VGLRERVKLLQGEVHIESDPASGTRVEVAIPIVPRSIGASQEA
jgi:signal transduction histidine kinase